MCSSEELAASGGHSKPVNQLAADGEQNRALQKSLDPFDVFSSLDFITSNLFYSLDFKILIMTTTSLIENFQTLAVKDDSDGTQPHSTCLPFNPGPDFRISQGKVDRYLFRLYDKHSDGSMNDKWVKSKDADKAKFQCNKDVFERRSSQSCPGTEETPAMDRPA